MHIEEARILVEELKDIFEGITCHCAEGPEFYSRQVLMDNIAKNASKGYSMCKEFLERVEKATLSEEET